MRTILRVLPALVFLALSGCGGGSNDNGLFASLTGLVTDVDGSPVVGARVAVGGNQAISQSNGSWQLFDLRGGYNRVTAQADVNGQTWSGETTVDVSAGEHNRNVNIIVSDQRFHGTIEGFVNDNLNRPISEAKVFVGGPVSSTMAVTNSNGFYRIPKLTPEVTYTVTASLAGFLNHTRTVHVDTSAVSSASFTLEPGAPAGTLPAPQNVVAQAWTVSSVVTRADSPTKNVYELMKRHYRRLSDLPPTPKQALQIERKNQTRVTPDGSLIEIDLFWDFQSFEDFFGYAIRRATTPGALTNPNTETAIARDPLTAVFFDLDYLLTPDVTYYYTVHRLETIDFPPNGLTGPPSQVVNAAPLQPTYIQTPLQNQVVANPTFSWTPVSRASNYTIYVWEFFPELLSDTDPSGVSNVWTSGNTTSNTSKIYTGPSLVPGHTYFWMVVANTADNKALSASEIGKFRTP